MTAEITLPARSGAVPRTVQEYIDETPMWADSTAVRYSPMTNMQWLIWGLAAAGKFFEGIKFRLRGVSFAPEVQAQITRAQATRTAVATARLDAQKRVEQAIGDRRVAEQRSRAIRATRNAYRDNPSQARIDALKALPPGLQSLGGDTSLLLGGNNR